MGDMSRTSAMMCQALHQASHCGTGPCDRPWAVGLQPSGSIEAVVSLFGRRLLEPAFAVASAVSAGVRRRSLRDPSSGSPGGALGNDLCLCVFSSYLFVQSFVFVQQGLVRYGRPLWRLPWRSAKLRSSTPKCSRSQDRDFVFQPSGGAFTEYAYFLALCCSAGWPNGLCLASPCMR